MHLTNYAINKQNEEFQENTNIEAVDVGHKRSMKSVFEVVEEEEGPEAVIKLKQGIHDIIIKSLCLATPHIKHLIKSCQPDELENQICYQILGFDILVDNKLVPSLLEIN